MASSKRRKIQQQIWILSEEKEKLDHLAEKSKITRGDIICIALEELYKNIDNGTFEFDTQQGYRKAPDTSYLRDSTSDLLAA